MLHELIIYQKHYDLVLYTFPIIIKYPKDMRFTLGQQTMDCLLDIGRLIVRANREHDRRKTQWEIDQKIEEFRLLTRLAKDLHLLPLRHYSQINERVAEIGRLLGGWIKSAAK